MEWLGKVNHRNNLSRCTCLGSNLGLILGDDLGGRGPWGTPLIFSFLVMAAMSPGPGGITQSQGQGEKVYLVMLVH